MADILSQKTLPWANEKLGFSKYYIHAFGSALTCLSEIVESTPDIVNEKLKVVQGFGSDETGELDQIIWEKIVPAFPGFAAQFITPYNNEFVVDALSKGQSVIVFTGNSEIPNTLHAVRYIGNGQCHDPLTGTQRPTSDFPDVKSFVVITKVEPKIEEKPVETPQAPVSDNPVITMVNLPQHEKEAILNHIETAHTEIKKILGL